MNDTPTPINRYVAEIRDGVAVAPKREAPPAAVKPPCYRVTCTTKDGSSIQATSSRLPSDEEGIAGLGARDALIDIADQFASIDYAFVSLEAVGDGSAR